MTSVGFEPTPMKTTALTLRLRPLGHDVDVNDDVQDVVNKIYYHCKISSLISNIRDLIHR